MYILQNLMIIDYLKNGKTCPENDWNNLTIDDYIKEIRNQKIFPKDFLQIDKGKRFYMKTIL